MTDLDKDKLAASVLDRLADFERALGASRRKYPMEEFQQFAVSARSYIAAVRDDSRIDRNVASAISGLCDQLRLERKTVPGEVLFEADRLACLLFSGYDPNFEGDEPPGL